MTDADGCGRVVLACEELAGTVAWFREVLGFRLDTIAPADDPRTALLSGHGLQLCIERGRPGTIDATTLRIPRLEGETDDVLLAPNGTRVESLREKQGPAFAPSVQISAATAPWIKGRAGMEYRDLVADRQGGALIASHIRIPDDGPVPDDVHFHEVDFQLIFCLQGRVRLVYEEQGAPFDLLPGDCVLQPTEIRHRVLEASGGLEVLEVTVPAEHPTHFDHELELPTTDVHPQRLFAGQRFVRHRSDRVPWAAHRAPGFEQQDCGIAAATGDRAEVLALRVHDAEAATGPWPRSERIELFFVRRGSAAFVVDGHEMPLLRAGAAITIPGGMERELSAASADLELVAVWPGLASSGG